MSRLQDLLRPTEIDPEARNRFLLIAGMAGLVAVALGLIVFGYYVDRIAPRGDTVFTVGDRDFSYAYLEDRVDAAVADGRFITSDISFGIAQMVSDLQNEELVRLMAAKDGVSISNEELDAGMRQDAGVPAEADRNVFAVALRNRLQLLGLSLDRYEELIEAELLEQKLTDQIAAGLPAEEEQVNLSVILSETDAQAAIAKQRITDGEAFEDVAREVSSHSSKSAGGVLGWTPRELLVEGIADPAFAQDPGTVSGVIETDDGFYILKVDGREVRAIEPEARERYGRTLFNDRLEATSNEYESQNLVTIEQAQRIASRIQSPGG